MANRIRRDDRSAVVRLEDGQSPGHVRCCVDLRHAFSPFVAIDLLKAFPRLFGHYLQTTCSRHLKIALCLSQNSPALRSPCSVRPGLWQRPRRRISQIQKKPEWTADIGHCQVTIRHGGKTVSIVRSGLPNVEETRFVQEGGEKTIAVKSRGNHRPALLELFDVHAGTLKDKLKAFAVEGANQPGPPRKE